MRTFPSKGVNLGDRELGFFSGVGGDGTECNGGTEGGGYAGGRPPLAAVVGALSDRTGRGGIGVALRGCDMFGEFVCDPRLM